VGNRLHVVQAEEERRHLTGIDNDRQGSRLDGNYDDDEEEEEDDDDEDEEEEGER
jgi:hypothetical protein